MARPVKETERERAKKYTESRLNGTEPRISARIAGYSDKTHIQQIERVGGPVHNLMVTALAEKGITEEFLANEYADGIRKSKQLGAREGDFGAHSRYLLQLGYLLGYGKSGPQVAVQINNNSGDHQTDESGGIGETLREVKELLAVVKQEIVSREPDRIPSGSPETRNAEAHQRVVDIVEPKKEALGGSES